MNTEDTIYNDGVAVSLVSNGMFEYCEGTRDQHSDLVQSTVFYAHKTLKHTQNIQSPCIWFLTAC